MLQGFLIAGVIMDAIAVLSGLFQLALLAEIERGVFTQGQIASNDLRQRLIGLSQTGIFLSTVVVFLMWFRRAYRNLPALGAAGLRFRQGWAIGAWFVPVLSLVRPKAIMNDIWKSSDPELPLEPGETWKSRPTAALLNWWWGLFLAMIFIGNWALRASLGVSSPTIDQMRALTEIPLAAELLAIAAGILGTIVVKRVTIRQEQRAARITRESPGYTPAPAVDPALRQPGGRPPVWDPQVGRWVDR